MLFLSIPLFLTFKGFYCVEDEARLKIPKVSCKKYVCVCGCAWSLLISTARVFPENAPL